MSFIQENIMRLNLGLSKEYTLIQFNDVHAVTYDKELDDPETIDRAINREKSWMKQRVDFANKFNEPYNPEFMLTSIDCLNQLIEYANETLPDLVVMTGDLIDFYSRSNHDLLAKAIGKLVSPYLFSCGNHESPSEYFQDICQGNCDFQYVDLIEFLVVSVNNSTRRINQFQLESLQALLAMKRPIILVMHVPIMTEYNLDEFKRLDSYYTMKYDDCHETTQNYIEQVSSVDEVKAILCGHTHGTINSYISPNKPQFCCSSGLIGFVNKYIIK